MTRATSVVAITIVLDTNVVLDWLAFRDLRTAPALDARIGTGACGWIATEAMRGEFVAVMQRGLAERTGTPLADALDGWRRHATLLPDAAAAPRWRCRDADDQKFIDLALARGASWLVTRDHDLLALARRMPAGGPRIVTPAAWLAETMTA